jgi:hypothetical protein
MAVPVSSSAHLEMELERAKVLRHDLLKSYVRMPDLQQRRIVEFAHAMGVPASSHEVYPSTSAGIDGTEHITGTSRRGYSPKLASLQRGYEDVARLWGTARTTLSPTLSLGGAPQRAVLAADSTLRGDPRFGLYTQWNRASITGEGGAGRGGRGAVPNAVDPAGGRGGRGGRAGGAGGGAGGRGGGADPSGPADLLMRAMRAGARIVAGTDTPNALNLHAELAAYVNAGMTPREALQTATVNAAAALDLDAGTIEPGKLADLVIVDGNPLEDIHATRRVKKVVVNGKLFDVGDLIAGTIRP